MYISIFNYSNIALFNVNILFILSNYFYVIIVQQIFFYYFKSFNKTYAFFYNY